MDLTPLARKLAPPPEAKPERKHLSQAETEPTEPVPENLRAILGNNLRAARRGKLSQKQLAAATGFSQALISQIEAGKASNPSLETVERLAHAVGKSASELLQAPKATTHGG